jgi:hypothetical protein
MNPDKYYKVQELRSWAFFALGYPRPVKLIIGLETQGSEGEILKGLNPSK